MQKLKWISIICLLTTVIAYSCKTTFNTTNANYTAVATSKSLERGRKLTYSICAGCHYDRSVNKFIGTQILDIPGIAGKVYAANLTNSKSNGIALRYSDAQIRYLLKTGIARDGRYLSYMLRPNLADEDINAIIVYLRSNDPAVSAADTTVGLTHLTFIGKAFMNIKAKPVPYRPGVKLPSINDKVAMGYYLVDNLGCFHCHSKSLTQLNYLNPDKTNGYLAGGMKLKDEQGISVKASNITPDKLTGIGNYSDNDLKKALKEGQAPQRKLKPPMPKFSQLSAQDVDAIYAYLETVAPVYHAVKSY